MGWRICLARDEKHLLGKSVGRIGFLGITIPKISFLKGHWSEFRIGADGSDTHELLYSRTRRILEQLNPHNRIFIKEPRWILLICANSAHRRCERDYPTLVRPFPNPGAVLRLADR